MRTSADEIITRTETLADADLDQVAGGLGDTRPVGPRPPGMPPGVLPWPPPKPGPGAGGPDPVGPKWPDLPNRPRDGSELPDLLR
jgi:hypothetical protein